MRATAVRYQIYAALIFLAALALIHPVVESGMNDDWSFIRTALDLASTGHLRYNGWSAPLIGLQAYWGSLFIKTFGFSFFAVRASVWVLTLFFIPVCWNLFRTIGLSEGHSFFGLIAFLLSPLNLPNLTTFMTDMPAFFFFVAALLSAIKAWTTNSDNKAHIWIVSTTLCSLLSGSIRQIYWLSGICFLTVLAFKRLRTLRSRVWIFLCITIVGACGFAGTHWLARQPYVPADTTLEALHDLPWREILKTSGTYLARFSTGAALLCLPFSSLFARRAIKRIPVWLQFVILTAAVVITYELAKPLPWLGNTLSQDGVLLGNTVSAGEKPEILSPMLILFLGSIGIAAAGYALSEAKLTPRDRFSVLTMPFMFGYIAIISFRGPAFGVYDRYLIPIVFLLSTIALSIHSRYSCRIGIFTWSIAIVFGLYAIATTHDYFAEARAKLQATEDVLRNGHSRKDILSGFEFDCWTQVEHTGFINNDLIRVPAGAYRQVDDCSGPDEVQMWWRTLTPAINARYVISLTPLKDLRSGEFKPLDYWRWLPPQKSRIYIQETSIPLTCKPDADE